MDLTEIIEGKDLRSSASDDAAKKLWDKKNAKALITLTSLMTDEQHDRVSNCLTACDMWNKLGRIHEQKSELSKNVLWQRYHEAQMEPGEDVMTFITRLQKISKQLTDLGQTITDESLVAKILMSLPDKFSNFVSAWDSTELSRQTLENLESRLVKEELVLYKRNGQQQQETALALNARHPYNNNQQHHYNRNHQNNRQNQHHQGENQYQNNHHGRQTNAYCPYCKREGHIERKC